jgi:transposase
MDTSESQLPSSGRRRGRYTDEFKAQVVAACRQPGACLSAVAQAHGVNASLVRRWLVQRDAWSAQPKPSLNASSPSGFVQIASRAIGRDHAAAPEPCLRLEIRKFDLAITVSLPTGQHSECAALLKGLLS